MIYSAWMGYGNYGCDVGGYRNDNTAYSTYFLRSAQLNAFLPLMENGGGGEHRPWMYQVSIYCMLTKTLIYLSLLFLLSDFSLNQTSVLFVF